MLPQRSCWRWCTPVMEVGEVIEIQMFLRRDSTEAEAGCLTISDRSAEYFYPRGVARICLLYSFVCSVRSLFEIWLPPCSWGGKIELGISLKK